MDQPAPLPRLKGRTAARGVAMASPSPGSGRYRTAVAQAMLVIALAGGMIVAPPVSGRILLVPLDREGREGLARVAVGAGAALVDVGPFQNSIIVSGERSALLGAMMEGHMLVLRAAGGGCGDKEQRV